MDATCSWNRDNRVVHWRISIAASWDSGLKILGLACTELVARAHDVGTISVDLWIEGFLQHVEHLRRMATTSQHDKQMGWVAPAADFGDWRILRNLERDEDGLE